MLRLLNGERVEIPRFNFITQKREYNGNFITLGADDVMIIEGIHSLNDEFSVKIPDESKFRLYVSALTQLNIDEHNRIPTTDSRLLRRMVRDYLTRGYSAADTISRWPDVRDGEEKNIFPYQDNADMVINSALVYEAAVIKPFAERLLFSIAPGTPEYPEAQRLLKFLDYVMTMTPEKVPGNSLLREFIGDSYIDYD